MSDIQQGVRRYLTYVMRDHGLSATALAKQAGVSPSTLTRFLNDESYKFTISNTTLEKIAQSTKIKPAPFLNQGTLHDITNAEMAVGEGEENENLACVATIGEIAPGLWRDHSYYDPVSHLHPLKFMGVPANKSFSCIVREDAIENLALNGDYVFCIAIDWYMEHYRPHDELLVVVQTTRDQDLIELTLKLAQRVDDGILLRPAQRALGPRQKSIKLSDYQAAGPVRIIGVVQFVFRYPDTRLQLSASSLGPTTS